jgi:hypothetical protein
LLSWAGLGTGAGGGAGALGLFDPITAAAAGLGGLGVGAMYSPQGRAALNYFLRRPEQSAAAGLLTPQISDQRRP